MFYLLVVAALGEELRSRQGPGEKSQRTATLVRHCTRHVDRHSGVAQLQNTGADNDGACVTLSGRG